jgi:hypothetical protein
MNSSSVREYLKKKEENDKITLLEIKKDIDNVFSLFSKGDESLKLFFKKNKMLKFHSLFTLIYLSKFSILDRIKNFQKILKNIYMKRLMIFSPIKLKNLLKNW